jgi:hypothetical protein
MSHSFSAVVVFSWVHSEEEEESEEEERSCHNHRRSGFRSSGQKLRDAAVSSVHLEA